MCSEEPVFGESCHVVCNPGFKSSDESPLVCERDDVTGRTRWTKSTPECWRTFLILHFLLSHMESQFSLQLRSRSGREKWSIPKRGFCQHFGKNIPAQCIEPFSCSPDRRRLLGEDSLECEQCPPAGGRSSQTALSRRGVLDQTRIQTGTRGQVQDGGPLPDHSKHR